MHFFPHPYQSHPIERSRKVVLVLRSWQIGSKGSKLSITPCDFIECRNPVRPPQSFGTSQVVNVPIFPCIYAVILTSTVFAELGKDEGRCTRNFEVGFFE